MSEATPARSADKDTRIALILSAMAVFGPFATDMYLASFPAIGAGLSTSQSMVQLTLSVYLIGMATGQLIYGPLADCFGRRTPLLWGVGVAVISSLIAALTPNIETLIGMRFLQAAGGCAGMVIGRAVVRDLYSLGEAAKVMSLVMLVQSLGPIIAPPLGGLLMLVGNWRSMFVVMTILAAVCWLIVWRHLPETLPPAQRVPLSFGNLFSGFGRLLRSRTFMTSTLAGCVAMGSMFSFITGSPFVFMELHGVSPQHYGYLFGLTALGLFVAANFNRMLLRRYKPEQVFKRALQFNLVSGLFAVALAGTPHLWLLMIPLLGCVATVPMLLSNGSALAMAASGRDVGSASSLYGLLQFGLASVVSALLGVLSNGTAYPMTIMLLVVPILGNLVYACRVRESVPDAAH